MFKKEHLNVLIVEDRLQRVNWIRENVSSYLVSWTRFALTGFETTWMRERTIKIDNYYIEI